MLHLTTPIAQAPITDFNPTGMQVDLAGGGITITFTKLDAQGNTIATVQVSMAPARAAAWIAAINAQLYAELKIATGQAGTVQ